jgi:hypothetical protein
MKIFETRAFVNQFVIGLLVMIGFGGTVGLGTVWMRHQVSVLAEQNNQIETQIKDVERHIASTSALVEAARSQDVLIGKNESMHLGLEEMTQSHLFAVTDDPLRALVAHANRRALDSERGALAAGPGIRLNLEQPSAPAMAGTGAPASAPANVARTARPKSQFAFTD